MPSKKKSKLIPIIVCGGAQEGRAVIFGYVEAVPKPKEAVLIHNARMILWWTGSRGLFGLATTGPEEGTRITSPVRETWCTCQETLSVTEAAARILDRWPDAV